MHLTPREQERLLLAAAADLARRRLARGAPLGATEAVALVCDEICELAWDGIALEAVIERARAVIPASALLPGVAGLVPVLEVEALFPWGTTLVHVDRPFPEDQDRRRSGRPGEVACGRRADLARARRCLDGPSLCSTPGIETCGSRRTSRSTRSTPPSRSGSRMRRRQGPFDILILPDGTPRAATRRPARRGYRLDLPAGEALCWPGRSDTAVGRDRQRVRPDGACGASCCYPDWRRGPSERA